MLVLLLGDLHLPLRASSLPLKFRKLLVPGKIQQIICTGNVCDRETWDYLRTVAPDVRGVRGEFDESPHLPPTLIVSHSPLRLGIIHGHQILPMGDADLLYSLATTMDVDVLVSGSTHKFKAFESGGKFFVDPGSATGAWCSVWPVTVEEEDDDDSIEVDRSDKKDDQKSSKREESQAAEDEGGDGDKKNASNQGDARGNGHDNAGVEATDDPTVSTTRTSTSPASGTTKVKKASKAYPDPIPSFVLLDIQGPTIMSYVYQLINGEVKVEKIEYRKDMDAPGPGMTREGNPSGYGTDMGVGVGAGMAQPRW